jgi:hypothetical protein
MPRKYLGNVSREPEVQVAIFGTVVFIKQSEKYSLYMHSVETRVNLMLFNLLTMK